MKEWIAPDIRSIDIKATASGTSNRVTEAHWYEMDQGQHAEPPSDFYKYQKTAS